MKIDVNGGFGVYRGQLKGESQSAKTSDSGKSKKTADVAEFSRGNTAIADKSLMTLKSNLQRDVNLSATPERIEQLRNDVKNGTYRVPTEALVDSILGE